MEFGIHIRTRHTTRSPSENVPNGRLHLGKQIEEQSRRIQPLIGIIRIVARLGQSRRIFLYWNHCGTGESRRIYFTLDCLTSKTWQTIENYESMPTHQLGMGLRLWTQHALHGHITLRSFGLGPSICVPFPNCRVNTNDITVKGQVSLHHSKLAASACLLIS
jgi:hypothetical protein